MNDNDLYFTENLHETLLDKQTSQPAPLVSLKQQQRVAPPLQNENETKLMVTPGNTSQEILKQNRTQEEQLLDSKPIPSSVSSIDDQQGSKPLAPMALIDYSQFRVDNLPSKPDLDIIPSFRSFSFGEFSQDDNFDIQILSPNNSQPNYTSSEDNNNTNVRFMLRFPKKTIAAAQAERGIATATSSESTSVKRSSIEF